MSAGVGRRNWLRVALAVSITLNLFLGGLVVGHFGSKVMQGMQAQRHFDAALAPLPEAKREAVRRELRRVMPDVRRHRQAVQQARAAAAEELLRPEPDSAALDRYFHEIQVRTSAMQHELQQAWKRAAADLTTEERRLLIDTVKRREPRPWLPEP